MVKSIKILIQGIEIDSNELRPIIGENIDRLCQSLKLLLDVLSTSTLESIKETGMFLIGGTSSIMASINTLKRN